MDKCPKCGAGEDASEGAFSCGTRRGVNGTVKVSGRCLRRQLAAANEKLAESARLATESAQLADGLAKDLAAANERAGRLEGQMVELREAWPLVEANIKNQLRHPELMAYSTFTRILGGS